MNDSHSRTSYLHSEPLPPEYRIKFVRLDDGSVSIWETYDGENWVEIEAVPLPDSEGEQPIKSETFFTGGAMTVHTYEDGTVTAE